eukprot:2543787-Rhodomonas_salina.1
MCLHVSARCDELSAAGAHVTAQRPFMESRGQPQAERACRRDSRQSGSSSESTFKLTVEPPSHVLKRENRDRRRVSSS